ncbi:MAG: molybdenum ABC transporter ATP-binding protein [Thermoanaerobaculia bacterium]
MSSPRLTVDVRLPLDRFELRVELNTRCAVTGVFGASGAGKSSLLETVAGLRCGARGVVRLGDEIWLDSGARRFVAPEHRGVGYVPQDGLLFPHLDVRHNLLAGEKRARRAGQQPEKTLDTVAELLELEPLLERSPSTLSGGERQRVALGRALCSGPKLLLLDEPLAALDLPLRRKLLPFLRRVRDELTVPMLLVSHDPIEVQALCDELIVLRRGAVVARGEPRTVLTDPEVFSLATEQGFENVLPGRMDRSGDGTPVVTLGKEVALVTGQAGARIDGEVLVGLPANEILIATEEPRGLSARNVLPAKIADIRFLESHVLVTAELASDVPPVTVEITEATPAELGLVPGRSVFLVIKATSCRLYGRP